MLFEQRTYTLKPGSLEQFWQVQAGRDADLVRPVQERLVGYFSTTSDAGDQAIHVYRYDSFADWQARLHGLYRIAALEPCFARVRALLTAQENQFFTAAPVAGLSPLWGEGRDWLPSHGRAPVATAAEAPTAVVERASTVLLPGTQPAWWTAASDLDQAQDPALSTSLIGSFVSLVGRLHQVTTWRRFVDQAAHQAFIRACEASPAWQAFQARTRPLTAQQETRLLTPAPYAALSPLFKFEETR